MIYWALHTPLECQNLFYKNMQGKVMEKHARIGLTKSLEFSYFETFQKKAILNFLGNICGGDHSLHLRTLLKKNFKDIFL